MFTQPKAIFTQVTGHLFDVHFTWIVLGYFNECTENTYQNMYQNTSAKLKNTLDIC